ncbi:MAG: hypothetical protein ACLFUB_16240 [Cyclobacteriaceae bacterium]
MTYAEFTRQIKNIGKEAVILLIGKRKVVPADQESLIRMGERLALDFTDCIFRSGNAPGSDQLFTEGVARHAADRLQFVLPYEGHRKDERNAESNYYALDPEQMAEEDPVPYTTMQQHEKSRRLIPRYLAGHRSRQAMKAPYLLRDTLMVIGEETMGLRKADFTLYYDDLDKPMQGGTGLTVKICRSEGVPALDQRCWLKWL